ncbi:TPA: hypothetical protein ACJL4U_000649 [Neisseria meningitidis]|nr:hypothetical protein [Neisseria meningitidis]MCL5694177.1 hypothetical protein [Neisseria meningitidis]
MPSEALSDGIGAGRIKKAASAAAHTVSRTKCPLFNGMGFHTNGNIVD